MASIPDAAVEEEEGDAATTSPSAAAESAEGGGGASGSPAAQPPSKYGDNAPVSNKRRRSLVPKGSWVIVKRIKCPELRKHYTHVCILEREVNRAHAKEVPRSPAFVHQRRGSGRERCGQRRRRRVGHLPKKRKAQVTSL